MPDSLLTSALGRPSPTSKRRHRVRLAAASLWTAILLGLASATSVSAHDVLIESDPADGAEFESAPERVELTFNAEPQADFAQIVLLDADESPVAELVPEYEGVTVAADLTDDLPAGEYSLLWRVVSSDAHPIEGTLSFTVTQDPQPTSPEATEEATTVAETAEAASPVSTPTEETGSATPDTADQSSDSGVPGWLIMTVAGVGLVAAAVALITQRRRRAP